MVYGRLVVLAGDICSMMDGSLFAVVFAVIVLLYIVFGVKE